MPSTRKPVRVQLVVAAGAALALVATTSIVNAQADPVYPSAGQVKAAKAAVGNKAAQIAVIEGQLKASNARLAQVQTAEEVAAQAYDLARELLSQRTAAAKAAADRALGAQKTADVALDKLGQFAATAYMQGGELGGIEAFLSASGPQDVLDRAAGIQLISDIRSRVLQQADASSVVAGVLRRQAAQAQAQQLAAEQAAESARVAAQAAVDRAVAETARIQQQQGVMVAQLAALRATSVKLEQQRQAGLKAEAERKAAAARKAAALAAAAAAARARAGAGGGGSGYHGPIGSRSGVVGFAQAQLGKPYLWGGSGPGRWDCSGLTQAAWARAGVNLGHYTGFQWNETRRVALADLQPGDLVFYGGSGSSSHHVGLYVGNDTMIDAPHTGAFVRYDNIYSFGGDLLPYGGRP